VIAFSRWSALDPNDPHGAPMIDGRTGQLGII
jgi:hypothetical protein